MADQKKWFKVWATILIDPHHSNLNLEDVGRWTRLGAMMVSVGEAGRINIEPPAKGFLTAMDCTTLCEAKQAISKLPNVQIEEGQSDNGSFSVIMQNWFKYQVDSTGYKRLKRSRYKRREEEKRGEQEERREDPPNPHRKNFVKPTPEEIKAYALSIGFRLDGNNFWDHYESKGWKIGTTPMKDWRAAVRTWKKGALPSAIISPPKPKEPDPAPEDLPSPEDIADSKLKLQNLVGSLGHKFP